MPLTDLIKNALTNYITTNTNKHQRKKDWESLVATASYIKMELDNEHKFNFSVLERLAADPEAASDSDKCLNDLVEMLKPYYDALKQAKIDDEESDEEDCVLSVEEIEQIPMIAIADDVKNNNESLMDSLKVNQENFEKELENEITALDKANHVYHGSEQYNKFFLAVVQLHDYIADKGYGNEWEDYRDAVLAAGQEYLAYKAGNNRTINANGKRRIKLVNKIVNEIGFKSATIAMSKQQLNRVTFGNAAEQSEDIEADMQIKDIEADMRIEDIEADKLIENIKANKRQNGTTEADMEDIKKLDKYVAAYYEKNKNTEVAENSNKEKKIINNVENQKPVKADSKYTKAKSSVQYKLQMRKRSFAGSSVLGDVGIGRQLGKEIVGYFIISAMIDDEEKSKDSESPITNLVNSGNDVNLNKLLSGLTSSKDFNNKFGNKLVDDYEQIINDINNKNSRVSQDCREIGQQFLQGYKQSIDKQKTDIIAASETQEPSDIVTNKIDAYGKMFDSSNTDTIGKKIIAGVIISALIDQESDSNIKTISDMVSSGKFDNIANKLMETDYFKDAFNNTTSKYKDFGQLMDAMITVGSDINNQCEDVLTKFENEYKKNPRMLTGNTKAVKLADSFGKR